MHEFLLVSLLALHAVGAGPLPRSTPEVEEVSSAGALAFIEEVDQIDAMNSLMLVKASELKLQYKG